MEEYRDRTREESERLSELVWEYRDEIIEYEKEKEVEDGDEE